MSPDATCHWRSPEHQDPAVGWASHRVLGVVPICKPCADKFGVRYTAELPKRFRRKTAVR